MPLRSEVIRNCSSTIETPILPFLAPSVFKQWPSTGRRSQSTIEGPNRKQGASLVHDSRDRTRELPVIRERSSCNRSSIRRVAIIGSDKPQRSRKAPTYHADGEGFMKEALASFRNSPGPAKDLPIIKDNSKSISIRVRRVSKKDKPNRSGFSKLVVNNTKGFLRLPGFADSKDGQISSSSSPDKSPARPLRAVQKWPFEGTRIVRKVQALNPRSKVHDISNGVVAREYKYYSDLIGRGTQQRRKLNSSCSLLSEHKARQQARLSLYRAGLRPARTADGSPIPGATIPRISSRPKRTSLVKRSKSVREVRRSTIRWISSRPKRTSLVKRLKPVREVRRSTIRWISSRPKRTSLVKRSKPVREVRISPTRWISSRYNEFGILSKAGHFWSQNFALVNSPHARYFESGEKSYFPSNGYPSSVQIPELKTSSAPHLTALIGCDDPALVRDRWERFTPTERSELWQELMLTTMAKHPDSTLMLLVGTYFPPYPPDYAVSDCINFIVSRFSKKTPRMAYSNRENDSEQDSLEYLEGLNLFHGITHLLRSGPPNYLRLSQESIFLLLSNLKQNHIKELYHFLMHIGHTLTHNTLKQYAVFFARLGDADTAFEIFKRLLDDKVDLSSRSGAMLCTTILATDKGSPSDLLASMVERGLKLDYTIYNVLICNCMRNGNYEEGLRIYNMMLGNGIRPQDSTHAILLNDAKQRLDVPSIRQNMQLITEQGLYSRHITTDILHATYLLFQQTSNEDKYLAACESTGNAFETILPVFCEYNEITPLVRLIPRFIESHPKVLEYSMRMPPPTKEGQTFKKHNFVMHSVVIMMTAYLREITDPTSLLAVLQHLRRATGAGDSIVLELLTTTYFLNALLMSLGRFKETLPLCPKIVESMLKGDWFEASEDAHPTKANEKSSAGSIASFEVFSTAQQSTFIPETHPPTHSTPTSLAPQHLTLIQLSQAEQAKLGNVASPGGAPRAEPNRPIQPGKPAKPDVHTWSILLMNFVRHQQPRAAEKVLELMTIHDIEPNLVTWNSLMSGYVSQQDTSMAVTTLERVEEAGFEADETTRAILSRLKDRGRLIEAMRRMETMARTKDERTREEESLLALRDMEHEDDIPTVGNMIPME